MHAYRRKPTRLERRVVGCVGDLSARRDLIKDGDKLLVAVGGQSSMALAEVLLDLSRSSPVRFELLAAHVDHGWSKDGLAEPKRYLESRGLELIVLESPDCGVTLEGQLPGPGPCSKCSASRRQLLGALARAQGCTKIALGNMLDDAIDVLFVNLFFAGRFEPLPPRRVSKADGSVVIRPALEVRGRDLAELARSRDLPFRQCACSTQKSEDQGAQNVVRKMIDEVELEHPRVRDSIRRALSNPKHTHLWGRSDS